jgi:hypothetical protein
MSEKNTKTFLYLGIAGAAVIAGAYIFHVLANKSSGSSPCFEEIDALGPPVKEPNGMLKFEYYKNMFMIISRHSKGRFAEEKKDLVAKRRKFLKEGNIN